MVPNQKDMGGTQPFQSHNHAHEPLQTVQEHGSSETGPISSVSGLLTWLPFAAASATVFDIVFPDSSAFMLLNDYNALCIPDDGDHHLPCR